MRVLVVEDERRLAENIARALREGAGYAVDVAADGEAGLDHAETSDYDLLVLDLMLPKLSGYDLLSRYRQRRHDTPVLVLTARDEKESVVRLLNAGADDYMAKPFDLGELLARAKALVRRGKGQRSATLSIGDLRLDTIGRAGPSRKSRNRPDTHGISSTGISGAPAARGRFEDGTTRASLRLQLGEI